MLIPGKTENHLLALLSGAWPYRVYCFTGESRNTPRGDSGQRTRREPNTPGESREHDRRELAYPRGETPGRWPQRAATKKRYQGDSQ